MPATQIQAKLTINRMIVRAAVKNFGGGSSLSALSPSPAGNYLSAFVTIDEFGRITSAVRNENTVTRNDLMMLVESIGKLRSAIEAMSAAGVFGGVRT